MNTIQEQKLSSEATDLAKQLHDSCLRKDKLPIDPAFVAQFLGAEVMEADLDADVRGASIKDKTSIIFLSREDDRDNQRLTCACEIGWLMKSRDGSEHINFREQTVACPEEKEALFFASKFAHELLLPESQIRLLYRSGYGWREIAQRLGVPAATLVHRLKEINLWI